MSETIQSFLNKVQEAASVLDETGIVELIDAVKNQTSSSKLRILIVGPTGSGRFSVANVLLRQPEFLPTSPIPKVPISVRVSYGESVGVEILNKNGTKIAIPPERLRPFLINSDTDATKYLAVNVTTNCNLLKTSEFRIESVGAKRSANTWKEILAGTDYTILVLKAVALLSEQERHFIRDILHPYFGLERVAIVINQMELVPEDERSSISTLVRTFLGPYQSQPLLIEFSAAQATKGMVSGSIALDSGYEALSSLVKDDLVDKLSLLKSAALRQAAETCLAEVANGAARQNAILSMSEVDLKELLEKVNIKNQWLQERTQRSQHKIEVFINTFTKEQFFREIEGFRNALSEQLPNEIMSVKDIPTIKQHLPGYLETIWEEFFNLQLTSLRSKLADEMQRLGEIITNDLRELLGDQIVNFQEVLSNFDPTPANMKTFLMPRRNNNQVGDIATGVQLAGFLLLFGTPLLGLTALGTGQAIRMAYKKDVEASDKQAIITSAVSTTRELERQIKDQVESHFEKLTQELKQAVADLYNQGVTKIRSLLEDGIVRHKELEAKKDLLNRSMNVTIPELRQKLEQLYG